MSPAKTQTRDMVSTRNRKKLSEHCYKLKMFYMPLDCNYDLRPVGDKKYLP